MKKQRKLLIAGFAALLLLGVLLALVFMLQAQKSTTVYLYPML